MRRFIAITALAAALAVLGTAVAMAATRTITLKPSVSFRTATGQAKFQTENNQRELEVEVEHIKVLAGKKVNVFVNGGKFATPTVSSLGAFDVQRNTAKGQAVPRIVNGSTVRVRTLGGTLIASGSF